MKDASNMPLEELLAPEVVTEKMEIELAELAVGGGVLLAGWLAWRWLLFSSWGFSWPSWRLALA
eukprot:210265-Pelagomonas_calceolata.AAC.16